MSFQLPDEPLGDGDHADVAARLHASLSGPSLDPATRQRHLQAIRTRATTLPAPAPTAPSGLGRRLASTVTAAGLVVVMGASGAVAASHDSLPGHLLYPVKHVTEQLVLTAPLPTEHAVERHLTFADRRLHEAAALTDRDADPELVAEAIAAHTRLLARADELAGDDIQLTGRVDAATATAHRRLSGLLDQGLPDVATRQARAALSAAEARLDRGPAAPSAPQPPPAPHREPVAPEPRPQPPAPPATPTPPARTPAPAPRPTPGPPADPGPPEQPPHLEPRQPAPGTPAPPGPAPAPAPQQPPSGAQGSGDSQGDVPAPGRGDPAPDDGAQPYSARP